MTENMQAGAQGAEANATQNLGDGATAEDGLVSWKVTGADGKEVEQKVSLEDLKAAWDKKITNQDKLLQKKTMEHARRMKEVEGVKSEYTKAIEQMNALYGKMSSQGQQSVDNINSGAYDENDIQTVLKQLDQFVSKKVSDTIGDKLKKVEELERMAKESSLEKRAAQIEADVKSRLERTELADTDKQDFIYWFSGKHDVSRLPMRDGYDDEGNYVEGFFTLFDKELTGWTKTMKERGLLSSKQYVDRKNEKNNRFSTDARGVKGAEVKAPPKGASMREHRAFKKQVMANLAEKYFGQHASRS